MPLEKIRALEARQRELEGQLERLADSDEHAQQLITKTDRLAISTDALTGVLSLFREQTGVIRAVDTKADDIQAAGAASRKRLWRSLSVLGLLVAVLIAVAVIGGCQVNTARDAAAAAKAESARIVEVGRQQCLDRNASLQVTIARERNLAETDVPATREAHRESALRYEGLIRNCDQLFLQNR